MFAITKTTFFRQCKHICKCSFDSRSARPQTHRAHTGCVNEPTSFTDWVRWQSHELHCSCGVSPTLIALAYSSSTLHLSTNQGIHNRAFADTTCAEQRNSAIALGVLQQSFKAIATNTAHHMNVDARRYCFKSVKAMLHFGRTLHEVELGQNQHGGRTTIERQNQFTFKPSLIRR